MPRTWPSSCVSTAAKSRADGSAEGSVTNVKPSGLPSLWRLKAMSASRISPVRGSYETIVAAMTPGGNEAVSAHTGRNDRVLLCARPRVKRTPSAQSTARTSAKRAAEPASERREGHARVFHRSSADCSSASRRARGQSTGRTVGSSESAAHDAGHCRGVPSVGHWSTMGCPPLVVVRQNAGASLDAAEAATNKTTANAARSRAQRRDFAAVAAGGAALDARLSISARKGTARGSSHEHREAVDT